MVQNGISVLQAIDLNNTSNPDNYQLRVDGSALQVAIDTKQDVLSSFSSLSLASLGLGGGSASEHEANSINSETGRRGRPSWPMQTCTVYPVASSVSPRFTS